MEDKLKQELSRENLNRLSSEFEVELLRLIKTLNLISQSRELYKNQVEQMESISSSLKIRINDFTIRLLEMEKAARESMREQRTSFSSPGDSGEATDFETIIREVNEFREKIDSVDKEIEKAKLEHLSKLDSFYSVYNLELKASQGELDTKLSDLKEVISEAVPAATAAIEPEPETESTPEPKVHTAPEPEPVPTNGSSDSHSEETPKEFTPPAAPLSEHDHPKNPDIPKRHINLSDSKTNGSSAYSSNGVLMGIIFIFFGALVGVSSFYLLDYISEDNVPGDVNQEIYSDIESAPEQEVAASAPEQIQATPEIKAEPEPIAVEEPEVVIAENTEPEPIEILAPEEQEKETNIFSKLNKQEEKIDEIAAVDEEAPELAGGSDTYTVVGVGANVRNGPGLNHEVATVVLEGDQFSGLGETRGIWIKVLTPDGKEGWISRKVVKKLN